MNTPITWIEGQARGWKIGMRRKLKKLHYGTRDHSKARQRLNYAHLIMKSAERTNHHIHDCHDEIRRLGGTVPEWPNIIQSTKRRIRRMEIDPIAAAYRSGLRDAAALCRQEAKRQFPIRQWRWMKSRGLYHTFNAGRKAQAKAAIRCARLIDQKRAINTEEPQE